MVASAKEKSVKCSNCNESWDTKMLKEETRDLSDLDERFTEYYESRERVEVTWKDGFEDTTGYGSRTDGKKARFYVGLSTEIKPIYLQIDNRRSIGGVSILSCAVESIRGLGIYE